MSEIEITQEDRDVVDVWMKDWYGSLGDLKALRVAIARHRQAARERALDEAAKVAETHDDWSDRYGLYRNQAIADETANEISTAIRKLKEG